MIAAELFGPAIIAAATVTGLACGIAWDLWRSHRDRRWHDDAWRLARQDRAHRRDIDRIARR